MTIEMNPMPIFAEDHGDHAVIKPAGYLNAMTGKEIEKACENLFEQGTRYFVINFSQVSMVNTIGISFLIGLIDNITTKSGMIYFTHLGATDQQVFEVLNLSEVALIFENDEGALDHMKRDQEALRRTEEPETDLEKS